MISFKEYDDSKKEIFIKYLEDLQDIIIEIDPLKQFVRKPEYGERYANELIDQVNKQGGLILFAEKDNNPVGVIVGIIEELSENDLQECVPCKVGTVLQLIVNKECRGQNIGSQLMLKMEEFYKKQNCNKLYVGVLACNKEAKVFYEKHGYKDRIVELMKLI